MELSKENKILEFKNGPLLTAIEKGRWIVIEDIDLASGDILERLNSLCEENPELKVIESGKEKIYSRDSENPELVIHENFRIFFSFSNENISAISAPLQSRSIVIHCDSLNTIENVQEYCFIKGFSEEAKCFGKDMIIDFRKVVRYLKNPSESSYEEEFHIQKNNNHQLMIKPPQNDKTNINILIEMLRNKASVEDIIPIVENLISDNISTFHRGDNNSDPNVLLELSKAYINHVVFYPLYQIYKTVNDNPNTNNTILNINQQLNCWLLFSNFDLQATEYLKSQKKNPVLENKDVSDIKKYYVIEDKRESKELILCYIIGKEKTILNDENGKWNKFKNVYYDIINKISELGSLEIVEKIIDESYYILNILKEDKKYEKAKVNDNINKKVIQHFEYFEKLMKDSNLRLSRFDRMAEYFSEYSELTAKINNLFIENTEKEKDRRESKINYNCFKKILSGFDNDFIDIFNKNNQVNSISNESFVYLQNIKPIKETKIDYSKIKDKKTQEYVILSHFMYSVRDESMNGVISAFIQFYNILIDVLKINKERLVENFENFEEIKPYIQVYCNCYMNKLASQIEIDNRTLGIIKSSPLYLHKLEKEEALSDTILKLISNGWLKSVLIPGTSKIDISVYKKECCTEKYYELKIKKEAFCCFKDLNNKNYDNLKGKIENIVCLSPYDYKSTWKEGTIVSSLDLKYESDYSENLSIYFNKNIETQLFNSSLPFEDKLILLCPNYKTEVSLLLLDILKDNNLNSYLGSKPVLNNINSIIPSVDQYVLNKYNERLEELKKRKHNAEEDMKNSKLEKQDYENKYEKLEHEFIEKVDSNIDKKKREIESKISININEVEKTINYIYTLLYHESVNHLIQNSKSSVSNVNIKIEDLPTENFGNSIKIVVIHSLKNLKYSIKLRCSEETIKINHKQIRNVDLKDIKSLMQRFFIFLGDKNDNVDKIVIVLPLSTYDITVDIIKCDDSDDENDEDYISKIDGMFQTVYYYNFDPKKRLDEKTIMLLASMISFCQKFDVNYDLPLNCLNLEKYDFLLDELKYVNYDSDRFYKTITSYSKCSPKKKLASKYICTDYKLLPFYYDYGKFVTDHSSAIIKANCESVPIESIEKFSGEDYKLYKQYMNINVNNYYNKDGSGKYVVQINKEFENDIRRVNEAFDLLQNINKKIKKIDDDIRRCDSDFAKLKEPKRFEDQIFLPENIKVKNSRIDKSINLSNLIFVTNIKHHEFILPKENTYFLPCLVLSRYEPNMSIHVVNISEDKLEVKSDKANVWINSYSDLIIVLYHPEPCKNYDLPIDLITKSASTTIHLHFDIKNYDNVYIMNIPCQIFPNNKKRLICSSNAKLIVTYFNNEGKQEIESKENELKIEKCSITRKDGNYGKRSKIFIINNGEWEIYSEENANNPLEDVPEDIFDVEKRLIDITQHDKITDYLAAFENSYLIQLSTNKDKDKIMQLASYYNYIESNPEMFMKRIVDLASNCSKSFVSQNKSLNWKGIEFNKIVNNEEEMHRKYEEDEERNVIKIEEENFNGNTAMYRRVGKDNPKGKIIKIGSSTGDRELKKIVGAIIEDSIPEEEKNKENAVPPKENEVERKKEDLRKGYIKEILDNFKKLTLDDYFQIIIKRRSDKDAIEIKEKEGEEQKLCIPNYGKNVINELEMKQIQSNFMNTLYTFSSHVRCCGNKNSSFTYIEKLVIIIDTSFTHRKYKSRLRSLSACLLLMICEELNIPTRIVASLFHGKCILISNYNDTLYTKMSRVFDLEAVEKLPSTPMDVFSYRLDAPFDDKNHRFKYIFISDCFSEQLLSDSIEIHSFISNHIEDLFLFKIDSNKEHKEELLSVENANLMKEYLENNFTPKRVVEINSVNSLKDENTFSNFYCFFYSELPLESENHNNKKPSIIQLAPESKKKSLNITFPVIDYDYIISLIDENVYHGNTIKLPSISDRDLDCMCRGDGNEILLKYVNENIKRNILFNSLNSVLITPNKSTSYVPSTTGSSINFSSFIKLLLTGYSDGKLFKKKIGNKIRSYSISLVLDASSFTMSPINISHTIKSFFILLRGFCDVCVPTIDIWVAKDKIIRIGTGLNSNDAWSSSIISCISDIIENCRLEQVDNTCLCETLQYAIATCTSRHSPIVFVLTNNNMMNKERNIRLKQVIKSTACKVVGIGVGYNLYVENMKNLFPHFLYSYNPDHLDKAILSYNSKLENLPMILKNPFKEELNSKLMNPIEVMNVDMVKFINDLPSVYEFRAKYFNTDKTTNEYIESLNENIDSPDDDLGKDGAFDGFGVLFVILYLCRGMKNKRNEIMDADITEDILRKGKKDKNGVYHSPIIKVKEKGFNEMIVYDYLSAIKEISTGKYRTVIITCSDGKGIFPSQAKEKENGYLDSFINTMEQFYECGGGIYWMLENYPFTYEADIFFKKVFGIEKLSKNKEIKGGKIMNRDIEATAGHFLTVGDDALKYDMKSIRIDTGLKSIYEGNTLACINESELEKRGFKKFACESEGNAAIMLKDTENEKGKIIVDTASTKLFLEFTSDGTSRWIANAVIWLLNIDEYFTFNKCNEFIPKELPIKINFDNVKIQPFHKRIIINLCLTIVMDCTGSMDEYIVAIKDILLNIIESISKMKIDYQLDESSQIVGQFVGYTDFYKDENKPWEQTKFFEFKVSNNFEKMKEFINNIKSDNRCGDGAEDLLGGLSLAVDNLSNYEDYHHMIIVVGDYPNHGDYKRGAGWDDSPDANPITKESWGNGWKRVVDKMKVYDPKIYFLSVGKDELILNTMKRLQKLYKNVDKRSASDVKDFNVALKDIIINQYQKYIEIS